MSDIKLPDGNARRHMSAMVWATRLHTGPLTGPQLRALTVWRAVPENQRTLDDSAPFWEALEELRSHSGARDQDSGVTSTVKIAACMAALTVTAGLAVHAPTEAPVTRIETQVGQWRSKVLVDGTVVHCGPGTLLRVEWNEQQRVVSTIRGEALFEVAKDSRPFLAEADGVTARALGTKFAMSNAEGSPVVTVAEGEVLVYRTEANGDDGVKVPAGRQVTVNEDGAMVRRDVDAANVLAWADRRVDARGQTVAELVKEFNRRNRVQIRVEDARTGSVRIYGDLSLDDPEWFANWLSRPGRNVLVRDQPDLLLLKSPDPATDNSR